MHNNLGQYKTYAITLPPKDRGIVCCIPLVVDCTELFICHGCTVGAFTFNFNNIYVKLQQPVPGARFWVSAGGIVSQFVAGRLTRTWDDSPAMF